MKQEPKHDKEFVKCLCSIVNSNGVNPVVDGNRRYGEPSLISSENLGWNELSVPRCGRSVSFENVYNVVRYHFFSDTSEEYKELPSLSSYMSQYGYEHFNAVNELNNNSNISFIRFSDQNNFDSVVLRRREKFLDCIVHMRQCEMLSDFPSISTYFNLFLKVCCMITTDEPGNVIFQISAPYIVVGDEDFVRSVYHKFNGKEFFKSCDNPMSIVVSDTVLTRNQAIISGNEVEKWNVSMLAQIQDLITPNYFNFIS